MTSNDNILPTTADTEKYDMLSPMFDALYGEIKDLSKKKQDDLLNNLKVKKVNDVLTGVRGILLKEPTIEFLDLLDDDTLPSNSDAALILAEYRAAMDIFYRKYCRYDHLAGGKKWVTTEAPVD